MKLRSEKGNFKRKNDKTNPFVLRQDGEKHKPNLMHNFLLPNDDKQIEMVRSIVWHSYQLLVIK